MRKLLLIISISIISLVAFPQCYPDRHNTTWHNGWVSCDAAINPNPDRDFSHWIMYDFGQQYQLGQLHIWNSNDPVNLDFGLKKIIIDYSVDAIEWTELGHFELEPGMGKNIYEGSDVVDFEMAKAKYVLITAESNYGGECFGLSEVRFELDSSANWIEDPVSELTSCLQVMVYPNPFSSQVKVKVESDCNEEISYKVTDGFGRLIIHDKELPGNFSGKLDLNTTKWNPGIYYLIFRKEGEQQQFKLVKIGD